MKRWFAVLAAVAVVLGGCTGQVSTKPVADDDFSVSGPRSFGFNRRVPAEDAKDRAYPWLRYK